MDLVGAGLCATCQHGRRVRNPRGSVFQRCERARNDKDYLAYPPLPVRICQGYAERANAEGDDPSPGVDS